MSETAAAAASPPAAPPASPPASPPAAPPAAAPPAAAAPAPPAPGPWWGKADYGLAADPELTRFLEGKNFPDLATALKSGMHADTVARDRNAFERFDPAKARDWKHWQELGWEPDVAKYRLQRPKAAADMKDFDDGMLGALSKAAHDLRLPVNQAQGLYDAAFDYMLDLGKRSDAIEAQERQKLDGELRAEWGAQYEERRMRSKQAMAALGVADGDAAQLEALMGVPSTVKLFEKIGALLGEDRLVSHQGSAGAMSQWSAKAEMGRLSGDQDFVRSLSDPRHPQHEANTRRWRELSAATVSRAA